MNQNKMPEMGSSIYLKGCSCNCLWDEMQSSVEFRRDEYAVPEKKAEDMSRDGSRGDRCEREKPEPGCLHGSDFDRWPIGMTYVPMQSWEVPFDLAKGLRAGTIFPSLRFPFRGGGC